MDTEIISKFILLVLLTQLGKTFITITRITTEIENDEEFGKSIHMVFTMNTLLNNRQFAKRLGSIEQQYGIGSVIIFASKNSGLPYKHVTKRVELQGLCADMATCPRVIVMCSNECRYEDGITFINTLNTNRTNIERVFAYYDELHKYISPALRQKIEYIHNMQIVKGIIAMTATPFRIWQKEGFWSSIRMIQLDNFNDENYAGYRDMIFNRVDDFFPIDYRRPGLFDFEQLDNETIGFINHTLDRYPNILANGSRTFIPAHIRRIGHNRVRTSIFERQNRSVVVVLNGIEKTLTYRNSSDNEQVVDLGSVNDNEICETIANTIEKHKLVNRPLVITGFLCVGMGQTLTHVKLGSFTSAIFGHLDLTNDEIYQLFGRITGRIKNWGANYTQTQVYCPTKIMHRCHVMEECARRAAIDLNGDIITKDDYLAPIKEMGEIGEAAIENIRVEKEIKPKRVKRTQPLQHPISFRTLEEVNEFLKEKYPTNSPKQGKFYKIKGFELSTRLNGFYKKKKDELLAEDRLTEDRFKTISIGMAISSKVGIGQQHMVFPVYPNTTFTDNKMGDVRYYVRYLPSNN